MVAEFLKIEVDRPTAQVASPDGACYSFWLRFPDNLDARRLTSDAYEAVDALVGSSGILHASLVPEQGVTEWDEHDVRADRSLIIVYARSDRPGIATAIYRAIKTATRGQS